MRRRIKRTTKQYIIVALISIIVIGSAAIFTSFVYINQIRGEYQQLLDTAYNDMEMNKKNVYVTTNDIQAGDIITEDNIERRYIYATQPEETYMVENDVGKVSIVDIPMGTQVICSMLSENIISSELRELEYNVININSNIINQDTVDIRISYPNGETYIILSKKVIKGFSPETTNCFFWMEEEEILRMSAAIVDAGLYPGSKLYISKYIEPSIQEESIITYTPSLSILSLIESDPNIVERCSQELNREVRKALENRMAASMALDVTSIEWNIKTNNQFIGTTSDTDPANGTTVTPISKQESIEENPKNYLFYAEEVEVKKGDVEYGE